MHAWAFEGDLPEPFECKSNLFELEWPPRSGKYQKFPEVDQACFFSDEIARRKLKSTQVPFLDRLRTRLQIEIQVRLRREQRFHEHLRLIGRGFPWDSRFSPRSTRGRVVWLKKVRRLASDVVYRVEDDGNTRSRIIEPSQRARKTHSQRRRTPNSQPRTTASS